MKKVVTIIIAFLFLLNVNGQDKGRALFFTKKNNPKKEFYIPLDTKWYSQVILIPVKGKQMSCKIENYSDSVLTVGIAKQLSFLNKGYKEHMHELRAVGRDKSLSKEERWKKYNELIFAEKREIKVSEIKSIMVSRWVMKKYRPYIITGQLISSGVGVWVIYELIYSSSIAPETFHISKEALISMAALTGTVVLFQLLTRQNLIQRKWDVKGIGNL